MPKTRKLLIPLFVAVAAMLATALPVCAQMGGMGGPGGGAAPPGVEKQRFRDRVMQAGGPSLSRETGDQVVREVRVVGNRQIPLEKITPLLRTRVDGFYNEQTVLADVRRLHGFKAFQEVTTSVEPAGDGAVVVTFVLEEFPLISRVIYHGAYRMNIRELKGRSGISDGDPINETSIESARRRLLDYYHQEGFNQVAIEAVVGIDGNPANGIQADPNALIFRINEGELERIGDIKFSGNTIVTESRLEKVIRSRGPMLGIGTYIGNVADLSKIDEDVTVLTNYYQSLGYVMAEVDRVIEYDESLKWLTVTFLINEGPQYTVNQIRIMGNRFIDESSLRAGLHLKEGLPFSQLEMNQDVDDITYSYGSLGFIYAEVTPELRLIEAANQLDVIYRIEEGDRWKVGQIFVEIEGEPNLMRETTMLNYIDLVEGQYIDRRKLEMNKNRLIRSELLETNPTIADPPDLKLVPRDEESYGGRR